MCNVLPTRVTRAWRPETRASGMYQVAPPGGAVGVGLPDLPEELLRRRARDEGNLLEELADFGIGQGVHTERVSVVSG